MKYFIFIVVLGFSFLSSIYPKKMDKKIEKEIKRTLDLTDFKLHPISVNPNVSLPLIFKPNSFFKIQSDSVLKGYLYYGQAKGKSAEFDYIVIFDKNLIIAKIKLMAYRESYGGEIGSLRWLKQFIGLTPKSSVVYKKNIAGISGATISASSLTRAVNKLLQSIAVLKEKQVL